MDQSSIDEQERHLLSFFESFDIPNFLLAFNLYQSNTPNTANTPFFTFVALLGYLLENNTAAFNKLIQTVTIKDLENEYIQLALRVSDAIYRLDCDTLRELSEKCSANLRRLLGEIYKKQSELLENTLREPIEPFNMQTHISHSSEEVIRDCVYVVKNFKGN